MTYDIQHADGKPRPVTVFKDADGLRHMLLVTSNGYKDREGEFLSTEALREYVDSNWDAEADRFKGSNHLLFWHQGPPIGEIIHADMEGPFLVEVARERASGLALVKAYTRAIWNYVEEHPEEAWGTSHGFGYDPADREETEAGPVYRHIRKFETSVLPLVYAANPLTYSGVISMSNKARDEKLNKIQPTLAERMRRALGLVTDELNAAGVEHKSYEAVMNKSDLLDVTVAIVNQVIATATEQVATKAEGDDGEAATLDVRQIAEATLDAFMDVPTVSLEAAEGILAVDDAPEPEAPAVEADGTDETEPLAVVPEPEEADKALKSVMALNEQLMTDQTALVAQQADILAALKALTNLPAAVADLAVEVKAQGAQVKKLQGEFEQRPRASRATETIAGGDMADLVDKAQRADMDDFVPRAVNGW
jgi:hypothetical protein